ncbi:MAG: LytTR family transcriptional regulator [Chlorobi bacterium]|nr:LytTR family transcriptional regulator [Chlorobiota bacterium]
MAQLFDFLKKPYPYNDDLKQNVKLIFIISVVLLVLLFLFQPFDLKTLNKQEKYILIGGIISVTFVGLSLNLLLLPAYLSKTNAFKNWTVLKEILWNIWILFTLATGYFIYFQIIGTFGFSFYILLKILFISAISISIIIPYNRNRLLKNHLQSARELNRHLEEKTQLSRKIVHFKSDYVKDNISLDVNDLLYIRSANNYIEIFWKEKDSFRSQMVRCTLKYAEDLLNDYSFIFKCHRAYIVNLNQVKKVLGKSQGYTLFFDGDEYTATVSRNYITQFKDRFYKI